MKLKTKMILIFTLVASISVSAVSLAGYYFAKEQLTRDAEAQMKSALAGYSNSVDGWLSSKMQVMQTTRKIVEATAGNGYLTTNLLAAQKNDDAFLSIYAAYADGKYFDSTDWVPPADYNPVTRDWYQEAMAKHAFIYTKPYVDADTKKYVVTMAVPVKNAAGTEVSILAGDILLTTISDMVKTFHPYDESYAFLLDHTGSIIAHPDDKKLSANIQDEAGFKTIASQLTANQEGFTAFQSDKGSNLLMYIQVPTTKWTLALVVPEAVIYKPLAQLKLQFALVALFGILLVAGCSLLFANKLVGFLEKVTSTTKLAANGDLTVKIPLTGNDEITEMAASFNQMNENLSNIIRRVNHTVDNVRSSVSDIENAAGSTGKIAEQISITVEELAHGATSQAQHLQAGATKAAETTKAVDTIYQHTEKVTKVVSGVYQTIHDGYQAVTKQGELLVENKKAAESVVSTVALLAERSQRIGQIVEVISNIAGQTNLLALNAAIEAARAGEAGRGFAVVAEEIRKLAEQVSSSSHEITDLIQNIQKEVQQSVKDVSTSTGLLNEQERAALTIRNYFEIIREEVERATTEVETISNETQNIVFKVKDINSSIGEIAAVAQQAAASSEEVAASTADQSTSVTLISTEINKLIQETETLRKEVMAFKV